METDHNIEVETGLIRQFQAGRNEAFDELLRAYHPELMVIAFSIGFRYLGLSMEEAKSAAIYGFYLGCCRFDTSAELPLMAYCRHWVKKAIREYNGRPKSIDAKTVDDTEKPDEPSILKADRQALQIWQGRLIRARGDVDQAIELLPNNLRPVISDLLSPDGLAPLSVDDLLRKHCLDAREFDCIIFEACTIFRNNRRRNLSRFVTPSLD